MLHTPKTNINNQTQPHLHTCLPLLWAAQLVLVMCLTLGLPQPAAHAARSLKKMNQTWELLLRNQLVQAYFCVGLLGDLHRSKVYKADKTKRYLKTLFALLGQKKLFLLKRKSGSSSQRAMFRHYLATTDMLLLSVRRLQMVLSGQGVATIEQFLTYRNAAAQNVSKMLQHPSLRKSRYYRGGWRKAIAHLGQHMASGLALGYLMVGLVADGYFQRVLSKSQISGYLTPSVQLLEKSATQLKSIGNMLNPADHDYALQVIRTLQALQQQGAALGQFVLTRKRSFLATYNQQRRFAWSALQTFGGP